MDRTISCALLCSSLVVSALTAQNPLPFPTDVVKSDLDSGYLHNSANQPAIVFRKTVKFDATAWLQFRFGPGTNLPAGSELRMTATADGGFQRHDGLTLVDWQNWSAAFNGGEVVVEILAAPNSRANRVEIEEIQRGIDVMGPESICGTVDNRALSTDPRQGRLFIGCTGWMISQDTMLTAGHCTASGSPIIEFNVPLSSSGGSVRRSNPNDQYPFTILNRLDAGVGSDWSVQRVSPNSTTGQLPTQRNGGQWYNLGPVPSSPGGQNIRITGYGSTSSPVSPTWYLAQKTHVGTLSNVGGTSLCYATDTTGGNSGSPIIHENTGNAIGIHSHGGCTSSGGCNSGTRIDRSDLQQAIAATNPNRARFTAYGSGCPSPLTFYELFSAFDLNGTSLRLTPVGGGYRVATCTTGCFSTFGSNLNLGDDSLATGLNLGFAFPFAGSTTSRIDVDSNGWIGLVSGQFTASDYSESVAEFLSGGARLAVRWDDFNPASGGGVYFDTFPGRAVITWSNVPQFGSNDQNTFQAQLFANGEIIMSFQSGSSSDGLTGLTQGNTTVDPGSRDLSASIPFTTGTGGLPVTLSSTSLPVLGSTIGLSMQNVPTNSLTVTLGLGFVQSSIDLTALGMPGCTSLVSAVEQIPMARIGSTAAVSLSIPNQASLLGAHVYAQGIAIAPGMNTLGVVSSNGGDMMLGN